MLGDGTAQVSARGQRIRGGWSEIRQDVVKGCYDLDLENIFVHKLVNKASASQHIVLPKCFPGRSGQDLSVVTRY